MRQVLEHLERAREAVAKVARLTPVLPDEELGVLLKAESLQRTGSFKVRGAAARMALLAPGQGVVAASAGNHAQGVALAAREAGVRCDIFMPIGAPATKIEAVRALGAQVRLEGENVSEALLGARELGRAEGLTLVHPFDDPAVIAGQATVGLELAEQVPDLARVIVPVGGGGLAAGILVGLRSAGSEAEVCGVQSEAYAPWAASLEAGEPLGVPAARTIADGIAVPAPGRIALRLLGAAGVRVLTVDEEHIAAAMASLAERAGLVVEGAGAVGVAALSAGVLQPADEGRTVVVLSGSNVDASVLAGASRRRETLAGRRVALLARVADRPGGLAGLLELLASLQANVLDIDHLREGVELSVGETVVQVVLETRGPEHVERLLGSLREQGFGPRVMH